MNGRLFIELYLDEDVDVLVSELLRARGFVALTTLEAGNLGSTDAEQLSHAVVGRKALLTHNRQDFERLAKGSFDAALKHHGIIIASSHDVHELVRRLLLVLNNTTADEMEEQVPISEH